MDQRRILVIGSQCKALGGLRFLPQLAQDLYAVMTDPERGACVAAIEGNGLVLDPSVKAGLRGNRPYSPRLDNMEIIPFISKATHQKQKLNAVVTAIVLTASAIDLPCAVRTSTCLQLCIM